MARIHSEATIDWQRDDAPLSFYDMLSGVNVAKEDGLRDISCFFRTLEPGSYSCPYHFHHNVEEMFVILSGSGSLRSPEGLAPVAGGDVMLFQKGPEGAHQLHNDGKEPLVYLDIQAERDFDVCEYPDTGKVNLLPLQEVFEKGEKRTYFEGEEKLPAIWKALKERQGR